MPEEASTWNAMAVLALFAEGRQTSIIAALRARKRWPGQWLSDVHAAYSVLARHPLGTDEQVVSHYDFLRVLHAGGQAVRVLDAGLARFPGSWLLHDRLRGRLLEEKGVDGLAPAYAAMMRQSPDNVDLPWFAGYASIVAAEFQRRAGNELAALDAYDQAIALYDKAIAANPTSRATADHYVALALAGRARVDYERADYEASLDAVIRSFKRKPQAAATQDGLNISPVDTAKMLRARLTTLKRDDLLAKLQGALDALDPELLELPAYEREMPPEGGQQPRRR
jgi:tetratricopeptide (TPR) repeat protein